MESRIKIGIICLRYGTTGGTEIMAQRIAEYAAAQPGFDVHVITGTKRPPGPPNITFHYIPRLFVPHSFHRKAFAKLALREARLSGLRVLHAFISVPGAHVLSMGTPHLFWLRDLRQQRSFSLNDRFTIALEQRALLGSDCRRVLAVSSLAGEQLKSYYPQLDGKLRVAEPGIETGRFIRPDSSRLRDAKRAELNFSVNDLVGLLVGNNLEHKGLGHVLAALEQREREGKKAHLLVIGKGNTARFTKEIAERGLEKRVHLLGTIAEGIEEYYFASDFFILPSALETFCIAALEAMAAELPVIISRNTGVAPLVESGPCGIIVENPEDTGEISAAIDRVADDDESKRFGENGRRAATNRDWNGVGARMVETYLEVLNELGNV